MRKFLALAWFAGLLAVAGSVSAKSFAIPRLQAEPGLESMLSWETLPAGLIVACFDFDGNGRCDFRTWRVVLRRVETVHGEEFELDGLLPSVVFVSTRESGRFFYIADSEPLFYGYDPDEDGQVDYMFKDAWADGVNGNEIPYSALP